MTNEAIALNPLFNVYNLSPGRRLYALKHVRERGLQLQLLPLVDLIDVAVEHDREVLDLDAARRGHKQARSRVRATDLPVDRTLVAIDNLLGLYAEDEPKAARLRTLAFPGGVSEHTRQRASEQSTANERVLALLEDPERAAFVEAHGLKPLVALLRKHHEAFAAALHQRDFRSAPTSAQVDAGRAAGQELYLELIAVIIAASVGNPERRATLMAPIIAQNEKVRALRRQRKNPRDVDPETGEVLEGEPVASPDEGGEDEPSDELPTAL